MEVQVVLLHAMKAYGGIAPLILKFGSK